MLFSINASSIRVFNQHPHPADCPSQVRVYHSNAGPHPAWLLEEVRVRAQGEARWTVFPCGRWLAVHRDDGWVPGGMDRQGELCQGCWWIGRGEG